MDIPIGIQKTILNEITKDPKDVRNEFLKYFSKEAELFTTAMGAAYANWKSFDDSIKGEKPKAAVSAIIYCAVMLHISSMKLFLSGNSIAAGNLQRQVLESIALSLLCSNCSLNVLERFMKQEYSPNKAVRDVIKHYKKLNLNRDALLVLKKSYEFYHNYSHPTYMTISSFVSFSEGGMYVGSSFDKGKLADYKKEVQSRISLAQRFSNFIEGVRANVQKW